MCLTRKIHFNFSHWIPVAVLVLKSTVRFPRIISSLGQNRRIAPTISDTLYCDKNPSYHLPRNCAGLVCIGSLLFLPPLFRLVRSPFNVLYIFELLHHIRTEIRNSPPGVLMNDVGIWGWFALAVAAITAARRRTESHLH